MPEQLPRGIPLPDTIGKCRATVLAKSIQDVHYSSTRCTPVYVSNW